MGLRGRVFNGSSSTAFQKIEESTFTFLTDCGIISSDPRGPITPTLLQTPTKPFPLLPLRISRFHHAQNIHPACCPGQRRQHPIHFQSRTTTPLGAHAHDQRQRTRGSLGTTGQPSHLERGPRSWFDGQPTLDWFSAHEQRRFFRSVSFEHRMRLRSNQLF